MQTVSVLGSTGAIGTRALEVLASLEDGFEVPVLVAGRNMPLFVDQVRRFRPKLVAVADEQARMQFLAGFGHDTVPEVVIGDEGLVACAQYPSDIVLNAVMGARGILPAFEAVKRGARLALANKECLVAAGDIIMPEAKRRGAEIIPVDSEHCALFQAMLAGRHADVHQWILTASGGPFRQYKKDMLDQVTVADALNHPNWSMGKKITVDSATLMNKGLEIIEAHHLFEAPYDKIKVLVHPESIVHSMVEYIDGSVVAQLATHDMRLPIQYAITFPHRISLPWPRLDFAMHGQLTFEEPDFEKFPALQIAIDAGKAGGLTPCVLNAANEVAVEAFLNGAIAYRRISEVVAEIVELSAASTATPRSVEEVIAMDGQARERARLILMKG